MGPEEILAQIRDLLDQYLALGGDTPVAPEAQQFADAIDAATGGGGEEAGGPPPDQGGPPAGPEEMPPPDQSGATSDEGPIGPPPTPPTSMADASSMALDAMKKKKAKAY